MILVVMGVAGAGKSTVGRLLAEALGFDFAEGDDFHPPVNVEKMRRGVPLEDADRVPWLDRLAERIDGWRAEGRDVVLSCSALKRAYRARLIGGRGDLRLVFLQGAPELIERRRAARRGHYMPAGLLASQFAALEPPGPAEAPIVAEIADPPAAIVAAIRRALGPPAAARPGGGRRRPA